MYDLHPHPANHKSSLLGCSFFFLFLYRLVLPYPTTSPSHTSWLHLRSSCHSCARPAFFWNPFPNHIPPLYLTTGVSGITESWGLKLLCYLLCLQGSDTEEKESRSSVTSSPNDKQIDTALWLWQSKQR